MSDLIRDAPFGQLVRYLSGNRFFKYPEERPDFVLPEAYIDSAIREKYLPNAAEEKAPSKNAKDIEHGTTDSSSSSDDEIVRVKSAASHIQRSHSNPASPDRIEADIELAMHKTVSKPIAPTRTQDGIVLVDWSEKSTIFCASILTASRYTTDDPANPQNWTLMKKFNTASIIDIYTFVVYSSSSIYVSSQGLIEERFGVGHFKGSLGLALYVLGMFRTCFLLSQSLILTKDTVLAL